MVQYDNIYLTILQLPELFDNICEYLSANDIINLHTVLRCKLSYNNIRKVIEHAYNITYLLKDKLDDLKIDFENHKDDNEVYCVNCKKLTDIGSTVKCRCWYCKSGYQTQVWYCDDCGDLKCERCCTRFSDIHELSCAYCIKRCSACLKSLEHNYHYFDYCSDCTKNSRIEKNE